MNPAGSGAFREEKKKKKKKTQQTSIHAVYESEATSLRTQEPATTQRGGLGMDRL